MVKMAEPYRHPETGVYYLRRQIPVALRIEFGGKSLWKRSLDTKDPGRARQLFAAANAELEERFARARAAIDERAERDLLSPEAAAKMVDRAVRAGQGRFPILTRIYWSEEAAAARIGGYVPVFASETPEEVERQRGLAALPGELWLRFMAYGAHKDIVDAGWLLIERVRGLMQEKHDAYPDVPRSLANDMALLRAVADRVRVELADLRALLASPLRRPASRLRPDMRMSELFEAWRSKRDPDPKSAHEAATTLSDFIAFAGDVAVGAVTGDLLYDFRDAIAGLPRAMPRADRTLPFPARVAKYDGHSLACVSAGSVKKRMGHLQAMIGLAARQRWIEGNPALGVEIEGYSRSSSLRRPFRDAELAQLFGSAMFLQPPAWSFARATVSDVTLAWALLLGLTNGARLEEIGQTELVNVKVDSGVWYFDLGIDATVKTESSRRAIPLHSHILACGFDRYVAALRAAGATRLFPDLKANKFDKLCHDASRLANRMIDREVGHDPGIVYHSLRHTFKDLGRDANLQKYILDQIMGHAGLTAGDRYGFGARLKSLKRELDQIKFDMIDWPIIYAAFSAVDWPKLVARMVTSIG